MPLYVYQLINNDGSDGACFEVDHPMGETLAVHPESGAPVRRVYLAPNLGIKHTGGKTKRLLENKNLEKNGFTKFVKDKSSGRYHRVAGSAGTETF